MYNISISGWAIDNYACENIYGDCVNCNPKPYCMLPNEDYDESVYESDYKYEEYMDVVRKLENAPVPRADAPYPPTP